MDEKELKTTVENCLWQFKAELQNSIKPFNPQYLVMQLESLLEGLKV